MYMNELSQKKIYRQLSNESESNQLSALDKIRGNRDNLQIILHFTPWQHTLWPIIRTMTTRLAEMALMRGDNICFHLEIRKIISELFLFISLLIWSFA